MCAWRAGGYHEGKLYGVDGDYTQMCNIYEIDPANGFRATLGAKCSTSYSFLDLAAAPAMEMEAKDSSGNPISVIAFGGPMFISNARTLVYLNNFESGTVTVPSFDIARKYPDVAAVAFLGTTMYRDQWPAQDYYILCADGTLAMWEIYATYVPSESRVGYTLRQKVIGNIGKRFSNDHGLSMTYVNDGVNEGLVVAYSDGAAELYYIDLQEETLSVGKLGNVGQATAIAAPYVTTNPPESSRDFLPPGWNGGGFLDAGSLLPRWRCGGPYDGPYYRNRRHRGGGRGHWHPERSGGCPGAGGAGL